MQWLVIAWYHPPTTARTCSVSQAHVASHLNAHHIYLRRNHKQPPSSPSLQELGVMLPSTTPPPKTPQNQAYAAHPAYSTARFFSSVA